MFVIEGMDKVRKVIEENRKLQKNLMQIAQEEAMEYKACFEIMGKGHNSYSKTDMEATFMRMKEECDKKRLLLEIFQYRLITLVSQ